MSEVKRVDFFAYIYDEVAELEYIESEDGAWVATSDYDKLHAELAALKAERDALRAENAELVAALKRVVSVAFSGRESSAASMCNIASNALAKRRGE